MLWIAALVALALVVRGVDQQRFTHWWDFSRTVALGATLLTWLLLVVVSALGIAAERRLLGDKSTLALDIGAALLSQASLRRFRTGDRGGTLVLGLLPDVNRWAQHFVELAVERWANELDDTDLLAAAARIDSSKRPRSVSRPTERTIKTHAKWRRSLADCLAAGGHVRSQGRDDLVRMVKLGYTRYLMRKP